MRVPSSELQGVSYLDRGGRFGGVQTVGFLNRTPRADWPCELWGAEISFILPCPPAFPGDGQLRALRRWMNEVCGRPARK